jgi:hypothetical protein
MTIRDAGKLSKVFTIAAYNLKSSASGNSQRIASIANTIGRVQALQAGALDDQSLQGQVVAGLWQLYSKVETLGLDDAHHNESLPCDDRQSFSANSKRGAIGVLFHKGRKSADKRHGFKPAEKWNRILPDSIYPNPEDQWALLSVYDKITQSEPNHADIDYSDYKPTKCRKASSPDSHISGITVGTRSDQIDITEAHHVPDQSTMGETIRHDKVTVGYPVAGHSLPIAATYADKRQLVVKRQALAKVAARITTERQCEAVDEYAKAQSLASEALTVRESFDEYAASLGLQVVEYDLPVRTLESYTRTESIVW